MSNTQPHLYLVDGSGFIFRAFHALPPLTRADGTPVNAVLGFCNMLYKLLEETLDADYLAVIFDSARKNFRHDIYPAYKANRPEPPAELIPQFALIREACRAFQVAAVEKEGFEADDLIATYARQATANGIKVTIVSSDKDLMQLVCENIDMLDPIKNRTIRTPEVLEKFGVSPERVVDVQALAGDSSDGVPGIPGIGIKTASELIGTFGSLDQLLERTSEIRQPKRRQTIEDNRDLALISRKLVCLRDDAPIDYTVENFTRHNGDIPTLRLFLQEQGFRTLIARLDKKEGVQLSPEFGTASQTSPRLATLPEKKAVYELIQDMEALEKWLEKIRTSDVVSIDTETTSLDVFEARLVGISLSVEPFHACYIPLSHRLPEQKNDLFSNTGNNTTPNLSQLPLESVLDRLKPLLRDESIMKVGHNLKYDMAILRKYGVTITPFADTMIMSYDLDGSKNNHNMDLLAELHLLHKTTSWEDVCGTGRDQLTFDMVDLEKARDYAAEDADITLRLYQVFRHRLAEEHVTTVYETIDKPLVPVLLEMENKGIRVDVMALRKLSQYFSGKISELEARIHELAGISFNVGSPKQLGEVLFEKLGFQGGRKSKSGAWSTDATVLENLAGNGHEIAHMLMEWRQLSKLKSTYTDTLAGQIRPQTGRIHTSYSITITSTGRLSSSNPNLQNIPIRTEEGRKIRQAFIPAEGCRLVSLDYSQIELRLLAHMAGIETLITAFHKGLDIHAATAADVFGLTADQVDSEHRRRAKAINFGIIYGISPFGLARQLKITKSEAATFIQRYGERYPGILAFMEQLKEEARRQGYVTTLYGRKCHVPGIHDKNPSVRGFAERQAINAPLQGTAADMIKRAMILMPEALAGHKLESKLLLQVHDELVFEVPEAEIEVLGKTAREVMENILHLSVPLVVDVGVGMNWDEAH